VVRPHRPRCKARVRGKAREALDAILAASPRLLKAHLLKGVLRPPLGLYLQGLCPAVLGRHWKAQLKWSQLKPYRKFVAMVESHLDGVLAYCDKKVSLGYIESANLKARNVIRRAYGYRDKE
jgi:transposase